MPEKQRPKISKYNLVTGVDQYASQTAQNPETARFMQGWIPGDDGALYREWNDPTVGTGITDTGEVRRIFQFDQVNQLGVLTRFFFAVVALTPGATTYHLWQYSGGSGGTWSQVTQVGTLQNVPSIAKVQSASVLHLSDGVTNWLFDGTSWVIDGMQIPRSAPGIKVIGTWTPITVLATVQIISDSNGNIQQVTAGGTTGANTPTWATSPGATTVDGTATWTCYGSPLNWIPSTVYAAHTCIYNSNNDFMLTVAGGTSAASEPTWDARPNINTTDNTITWVNRSKFVALETLGGLGWSDLEWLASNSYSTGVLVIDTNGNIEVSIAAVGNSGNSRPAWNQTVGGTTTDGGITWKNFGLPANLVPWQPLTTYVRYQPVLDSNGFFEVVTNVSGVSGANQPPWAAFTGSASDGTVIWMNVGAFSSPPPTALIGKYYWYTNADQTVPRIHESSSSPISVGTGPLNHQQVYVYQTPGQFTSTIGSQVVTIGPNPTLPNIGSWNVGQTIFVPGKAIMGIIASVAANGLSLTLVANAPYSYNGLVAIGDARMTHIHWYESESDGSKIGQQSLISSPITTSSDPLAPNTVLRDVSQFFGGLNSSIVSIFRPVRNDPPVPSLIAEVHKYRIWRRRESRPNFFNYTANEEVSSGLNGDPTECDPGTDPNTLSDIINEQVYPDSSNFIRAICSHGDALYIATEKQCVPLYGQSIDDFGISQVTAFSLGVFGPFAMISTAHGLAFVSYDGKIFLYPTSNYYWAYVPNDVNVTDNLIEIGKPLRKRLENTNQNFSDRMQLTFYFFGRRNWLLLTFQNISTNLYETWVYDFTNKGWFQLAGGYSSTAVIELSTGDKILVGGTPNGSVKVIDDLTNTFTSSGNQPNAVWRPALIDFGDPDMKHIPLYVEIEFSNVLMANDLTINYYLDPVNVDSPGTPRSVILQKVSGSNLFRGFFQGGNLCQRLLVEFNAASSPVSTNSGAIRGIKLVANPASGLLQ